MRQTFSYKIRSTQAEKPHYPARRATAAAGSWRLSRLLLPLRRLLRVSSLARGLLLSGAVGHTPEPRSL